MDRGKGTGSMCSYAGLVRGSGPDSQTVDEEWLSVSSARQSEGTLLTVDASAARLRTSQKEL